MLCKFIAAIGLALTACVVAAQQPVTVEELARLPAYQDPESSRNGLFLAVRVPINGRMNLAVIDLEARTRTTLTQHADVDVVDVTWVGNDRILYSTTPRENLSDEGDDEHSNAWMMVTRDGARRATIFDPARDAPSTDRIPRSLRLFRILPGSEQEVLAIGNLQDPFSNDIYRVNIDTGARALVATNRPAGAIRYLLDGDRVPRAVLASIKGTTNRALYYRVKAAEPWREVARFDATRPGAIHPLFLTADSRRIFVASNQGRENMAIFIFDPESGKLGRKIFEHPRLDFGFDPAGSGSTVGSVSIDASTEEVMAEFVNVDKPQRTLALEDSRRFQRMIDRLLPDTFNSSMRLRGDRYLVRAMSATWPSTWHLFNEAEGTLEDLFASRQWLLPDRLAPLRSFELKTRDGLSIPSHYFLPKGVAAGARLPTVVLLIPGPGRRLLPGEYSAVTQEAQALAARGYAVVMPAVRGTPGFGNRIYYAGFGALGRQAIDDVADAAGWAVAEGFADASRICVSGSHLGGYAALMALARHPKVFRCGAASSAVSDLPLQFSSPRSIVAANPTSVARGLAWIGADSVSAIASDLSPVNLAAQIKQPVALHWNRAISDSPLEQTSIMVEALKKAGNPPTVSGSGEASPVKTRSEATAERLTALLKFFDDQIGTAASRR